MTVSIWVIIGMCITFTAMIVVGLIAMKKVKSSEDFTVSGRRSTAIMVAGAIVGTCIGSGATIGTAQTAFTIGIVGWWQTLGLSIGVLILGLVLAQVVYKRKVDTVPQILEEKYGSLIRPLTAIFSAVAIFFSILSQTKGFLPLLQSITPVSIITASVICVGLSVAFVVFGGIFASSLGGLVKTGIIIGSCVIAGVISVIALGGFAGITTRFEFHPWLNLFARGVGNDLAIGLGFVLGVLVTQVYIQAILSAKDAKAARNGAILASIFTMPVGLLAVSVGLYMNQFHPDIVPSQALPLFMLNNFNPIIAGIFIGGLMLAALGSNSGLIFGVSTMLSRDVYKRVRSKASDKEMIMVLRLLIIAIAILAGTFAVTRAGELIQTFIFLSFGMRTTVFLVPMLFTFYYKGRLTKAAGIAAVLAGPLVNIIWNLFIKQIPVSEGTIQAWIFGLDPIYTGLFAALAAFIIANIVAIHKEDNQAKAEA